MLNLEIKLSAPFLEDFKNKAISLGAENKGVLDQTDTYFFIGRKTLKLREESSQNYLVYYIRNNDKESKFSKYHILNIPKKITNLVKSILDTIFRIKIVINKKRELFIYKNTRIHFDTVENLGNFIELETVFGNNSNDTELEEENHFVIQFLELNTLEKVSNSYSLLLLLKNQ